MDIFNKIKQHIINKKQKEVNKKESDLFKYMESQSFDAFIKNNLTNFDDNLYDTLDKFSFDFGAGIISVGNYIKNFSGHNCHACATVLAIALGLTHPELQPKIKVCHGSLINMKYQWNGNTEHSWVEVGDTNDCKVYDTSWHKVVKKESYYKIFNPLVDVKLKYDEIHSGYVKNLHREDFEHKI